MSCGYVALLCDFYVHILACAERLQVDTLLSCEIDGCDTWRLRD